MSHEEDIADTDKPQRLGRLKIGANVLMQVGLVLLLAVMVNYLGFEHYKRWDLSRDRKYTLSDKTKRFLQTLKGKMRATVFFDPENPIGPDVLALLTQYQDAAKGRIDVEVIDPARNLSRAREVLDRYKVVTNESVVILDYETRNKTVKASEMAEMDPGNAMFGESPKVSAFKGEQAVTAAMLDLVEGKKNVLGYITGHGEPGLGQNSPLNILKTFIENENVKFQELNLFDLPSIPSDVRAIMIAGPQYDFSEREMQLLREFWEKQGRVLLLIDPAGNTPRLEEFARELGVRVNDDRLMAIVRTGIEEVRRIRDVIAKFLPGSPITKRLTDVQAPIYGPTSSLTLEAERGRAANIQILPLAQAEEGYWAETSYNSTDETELQFTPGKDRDASLHIAAAVERGGTGDERVQVNSSRMIVVGNATLIHDQAIVQGQQTLDFMSGCVNWLLSREKLIGIAPKIPQALTFNLDERALATIRWLILLAIPLVPALLGLAVWWQRRT